MSSHLLQSRWTVRLLRKRTDFSIRRCESSSSNSKETKLAPIETSQNQIQKQSRKSFVQTDSERLPRRIQTRTKAPIRYDMQDEDPEQPKHEVFQQITKRQSPFPIYALEDAHTRRTIQTATFSHKYPGLAEIPNDQEHYAVGCKNEDTILFRFPEVNDIVIVGSGLIGSAVAYYMKKKVNRICDVCVIDKNPYSLHNCTATCSGLLSSQSKSRDISRMASISKELIRCLRRDVLVTDEDFAKIKYRPCTHLILWPESEVEDAIDAVEGQNLDFAYTEAKTPSELQGRYPYLQLRDSDVAIGTHGNQDEALIDPIALRNLYRTLAQAYGAFFVLGEVIDFNCHTKFEAPFITPHAARAAIARIPATGELINVNFSNILLSLGHNTPFLENRVDMEAFMRDTLGDMHYLRPKLRISYTFSSQQAPVLNFPVITDTDGSTLIKDDYAGLFRYYMNYEDSETLLDVAHDELMGSDPEEPYVNLIHRDEVFESYFNNVVKPKIVKRIPCMEDAKFQVAHSGYESYNTHDGCPVFGRHPYHRTINVSGGFGSRLMTLGPAAAATIVDVITEVPDPTFDISNFSWHRVSHGRRMDEFKSVLGW